MHICSMLFYGLRKLGLNDGEIPSHVNTMQGQPLLSPVNLLIGPNGGGKSTAVDIIRSLSEVGVLKTLVRENLRATTKSGFELAVDNGRTLTVALNKTGMDEAGVTVAVKLSSAGPKYALYRGTIDLRADAPVPGDLEVVFKMLGACVHYRNWHDETGVPNDAWIAQLNLHASHLIGVGSYPLAPGQHAYLGPPGWPTVNVPPLHLRDEDSLSIRFNDDQLQQNHVRISALPSGWRAFAGLLAWLATRPENCICVVEEPEIHLHPTLQRVLMQAITRIATERGLQIFITTHSAALIDFARSPASVGLFEADGWRLRPLSEPAAAVQMLGGRPSDLCLANGLVWVEGPSDRLYLLHWLKLWCDHTGQPMPAENIAFAFSMYGGALLHHYSAAADNTLIRVFDINPRAFLLMDRDLDFLPGPYIEAQARVPTDTKARILREIRDQENDSRTSWVTDGYTIESYLPDEFRKKHFGLQEGRLRTLRKSKVEIAHLFSESYTNFADSYSSDRLPEFISKLHATIQKWQHDA